MSSFVCSICDEFLNEEASAGTTNDVDFFIPKVAQRSPPRKKFRRPTRGRSVVNVRVTSPSAPGPAQQRNRSEVITTPCGHLFHHVCILQWFTSNSQVRDCPICRRSCNSVKNLKTIFLPVEQIPDLVEAKDIVAMKLELQQVNIKLQRTEKELETSKKTLQQSKAEAEFLMSEVLDLYKESANKGSVEESKSRVYRFYGSEAQGDPSKRRQFQSSHFPVSCVLM